MNTRSLFAITVCALFMSAGSAYGCEEFRSLSGEELKEYRDILSQNDADPFDRIAAFQHLACSDNPNIRSYAIREGLKTSNDPLVRHQILLESLMQKTRINIELSLGRNMKDGDKRFFETHAGIYSKNFGFKDRVLGCISFERRGCDPGESLQIKGGTVELNRGGTIGIFKLTDANELVGFLRPQSHPSYSKIPAIIRLH